MYKVASLAGWGTRLELPSVVILLYFNNHLRAKARVELLYKSVFPLIPGITCIQYILLWFLIT